MDIANALDAEIEYILGIDKEADFIRDFINAFDRITTTKEYSANNGGIYNSEDSIFETNDDYLMLTGNESLFVLIKEIAKAKNLQTKLSNKDYHLMLKSAKQNFKQNKDNGKKGRYFLISGKQMTEIIELAAIRRGYLEALFEEIGITTPLEGQSLPDLKSIRKNKNERK